MKCLQEQIQDALQELNALKEENKLLLQENKNLKLQLSQVQENTDIANLSLMDVYEQGITSTDSLDITNLSLMDIYELLLCIDSKLQTTGGEANGL